MCIRTIHHLSQSFTVEINGYTWHSIKVRESLEKDLWSYSPLHEYNTPLIYCYAFNPNKRNYKIFSGETGCYLTKIPDHYDYISIRNEDHYDPFWHDDTLRLKTKLIVFKRSTIETPKTVSLFNQ